MRRWLILACLCCLLSPAAADDTSTQDKLRMLYANRFTFTDQGLPLITIEIMSGQREVVLSAPSGVRVRPDGEGGSTVQVSPGTRWVIRSEASRAAEIVEWTVVESVGPEDEPGVAAALARWQARGFVARAFEVGSVFGVDGEIIDSRSVRIAIDPAPAGLGAARARAHAKALSVTTFVHAELVRRPTGTIVAESGPTVLKNPNVLWFAPNDATETLTVHDVVVGGGGSQLTTSREDRRYWGSVYVTLDRDGKLVVANAVPEDKLLAGLVPAEIFPDAPDAALEAQAIAARTELLEKVGHRNLTDPFLLCSTQACQVYAGAGKETPRTTRAVQRTRGMVALRGGGGLVDARYSASCGGHSEDNDTVWGGEPDPALRGQPDQPRRRQSRVTDETIDEFLAGGDDAYCAKGKQAASRFRWEVTVDAATLSDKLAADHPQLGRVQALRPLARGVSGRIRELELTGDRGTTTLVGELVIRRALGGLKSSLFAVTPQGPAKAPTGFLIRGAGFGHGVGMCQMGAIGMANAGKRATEIIEHYYRGSHVHRLY